MNRSFHDLDSNQKESRGETIKGGTRHTIGAIAPSNKAGGCGDATQKSRDYARPGALPTNVGAEIISDVHGKRRNSEDFDLMICTCIHFAFQLATAASMLTRHFCTAFLSENNRQDSLHYTDARGKSLVNT